MTNSRELAHQLRATLTLPSDTQIVVVRDFTAPRHAVWRAWTEPDLVARWWHADRGTVTSIDIDLRPGGAWRYAMAAHGGQQVAFLGTYSEVVTDEVLVNTEIWEGAPDATAVVTTSFTVSLDIPGGTTVTIVSDFASNRERDLLVEMGMEDGLQDALVLLEGVARSLTQQG